MMEIDLAILGQVATESDIKGEVVLDLIERLVLAESELEAIKKQEPAFWTWAHDYGKTASDIFKTKEKAIECWSDFSSGGHPEPVYKKPVYQHSFTVDGHTFYADNEVDILYLERKFGVGGKAKLEVVKDER